MTTKQYHKIKDALLLFCLEIDGDIDDIIAIAHELRQESTNDGYEPDGVTPCVNPPTNTSDRSM